MKTTVQRPRLLFFAYPFPPSPAIGAVRAWNMARYLSRMDWDITVLTPDPVLAGLPPWKDDTLRELQAAGIRLMLTGDGSRLGPAIPFSWMRWMGPMTAKAARRLFGPLRLGPDEAWLWPSLRRCRRIGPKAFDLILATGSPFCSFLSAGRLSKRLQIPLVLDYRDPWSQSAFPVRLKWLFVMLERWALQRAKACTIVSPSWSKLQQMAFHLSNPPEVLSNGYDPEEMDRVTPHPFDHFAVVYAGSFYRGQREIDPVVRAVQAADARTGPAGPRIRLHYFGHDTDHVEKRAARYDARHLVHIHGQTARAQVLAAIKGAGAAAVIASIRNRTDLAERGIITGKLFEPLGLGTPILLVAPMNSDATAIVEPNGAGKGFTAQSVEAMGAWLADLSRRPDRGHYLPPSQYSWPAIARQMNTLLRQCLSPTDASIREPLARRP